MSRPNVIMSPQQDNNFPGGQTGATITSISTTTSETRQLSSTNTMQPPLLRWPEVTRANQPTLPSWVGEVPLNSPSMSQQQQQTFSTLASTHLLPNSSQSSVSSSSSSSSSLSHCPELIWRQIRWPSSEPNSLVQMPCPAHAIPSSPPSPFAASFACLPNGQWSSRVQAARCQSIWLRNLTKSLDDGDSPLSILTELAHRTRPQPILSNSLALNNNVLMGAAWNSGNSFNQQHQQQVNGNSLFGDDIIQIGRIVRRLVDELGDLLTKGIPDDKQRSGFAREILQVSDVKELAWNFTEHMLNSYMCYTALRRLNG